MGLEPTHTRHQILSLARLPITTRPELKHPNDFRSHICRVPDGFNSPSPYEPKTLINILTPWFHPILWNYFTVYPNLKCFNFKINVCCYAKGKSILTSYGVTFYYPLHLYLRNVLDVISSHSLKDGRLQANLHLFFERDKRLELSP